MNPESQETPERKAASLQSEIDHETGADAQNPQKMNRFAVLQIPDYRRYLIGGVFAAAGSQMTNIAAGWELYERTNNPFSLGLLGLMGALPVIFLALPAGTLADRVDRRRIVLTAEAGAVVCLLLLALISWAQLPLPLFYGLMLCNAVCGAFLGPALGALVTNVVPPEHIPAAIRFGSIRWQLAATLGPVAGGFLIAYFRHAAPIYALDAFGRFIFCGFLWPIRPRSQEISTEKLDWSSVAAGWHFVKGNPLIISTITLDMVAVLFGGATALLPIYARDILAVGPEGLGPLRAAPAMGAILMGVLLTILPPFKRAGWILLFAVAGFGAATVVFGLSRNYALSLGALFTLGALDNISVVIRSTLIQILTPDVMRGRVNAVNSVFIGTSNEIGELESGGAAALLGPIAAVAIGGGITILVVSFVAAFWPQVRRLGSLESVTHRDHTA
ncbi:putative arabinose efflux permease, MFS family [Abditibacterium utsteinense]|uniref:Putative arabinose efflux permease, MFS family n=1 Tax=Abditibacterium utsteinense TaxID=1960156 RepID=A0A2S8SV70_9BACT|nr:MFS transporter [Abditibacterium utsteinense]PQV64676.1 putative arabinose efflux permease, MFS family [Abditibacterium utsteinense]